MSRLTNSEIQIYNEKGILTCNASPITTPNINAPLAGPLTYIQPEAIKILTAVRNFEKLGGKLEKNGSWGQDSLSIKTKEYVGKVQPYTAGNSATMGTTTSDVNLSYVPVGVYYYENSWSADDKEVSSAGFFNENLLSEKAEASMLAIAIERNAVNFLGKKEKGLKLPVYGIFTYYLKENNNTINVVKSNSNSQTSWQNKTTEEIFNDIVDMINALNIKSKGNSVDAFNAGKKYNIGVANAVYGLLDKTNQYGLSVRAKLKEQYGDGINLVNVPELDGFASGDNCAWISIDGADNVETIKGSYVELARTFQIDRLGSVSSQKIASAISGGIVQRPMFAYMVKGI